VEATLRLPADAPLAGTIGTVIISGGASGLGAAIADAAIARGGRPIVFDVRAPGADVEHRIVDIADRPAVERAVAEVAERFGGIDAVVANAGTDSCGPFGSVPAVEWERVIGVNLLGTAALVRAALPHLERVRGKVVTVASTLGIKAVGDATAYCASKFGVVGFTRALAVELKERVGVTLLVPGGMHTAFFDGRTEQYKPPADAKLNQPSDVANAVLFALMQPHGCEIREMVIAHSAESSWP